MPIQMRVNNKVVGVVNKSVTSKNSPRKEE